MYNNVTFYVYNMGLKYSIHKLSRLSEAIIEKYNKIVRFKETLHHIHIQPWWDTQNQCLLESY